MKKVTWKTQIFSGFFLVLIAALAILVLLAVIMALFNLDFGMGPWYVPLGIAVIISLGIVFGNTRKEPTALRKQYQDWLAEQETNDLTRIR